VMSEKKAGVRLLAARVAVFVVLAMTFAFFFTGCGKDPVNKQGNDVGYHPQYP